MIIGVTGHQILPAQGLTFIEAGVERVIRGAGSELTGVSSLAAGADQLFASLVLRSGGRLHVILPCEGYEATFESKESFAQFHELLARAITVETLAHKRPSEEAYLDAGRCVADRSQVLIAIWDGDEARGKGGTADIVHYARERKTKVIVIWPEGLKR